MGESKLVQSNGIVKYDKKTLNVFVSRPSVIGPEFLGPYDDFDKFLVSQGLVVRRLGASDYTRKPPLRAVIDLIDECCGAIILGYPQVELVHHVTRNAETKNKYQSVLPTPWNQIEGALAYARRLPILVIAHPGIDGGVFDHGITGEFVLHVDLTETDWFQKSQFTQPFNEWLADVRSSPNQ